MCVYIIVTILMQILNSLIESFHPYIYESHLEHHFKENIFFIFIL